MKWKKEWKKPFRNGTLGFKGEKMNEELFCKEKDVLNLVNKIDQSYFISRVAYNRLVEGIKKIAAPVSTPNSPSSREVN